MRRRPIDKYHLYTAAVQDPSGEARFLERIYRRVRGRKAVPRVLREDFCAAYALCCAWVRNRPERNAIGIDLDPEPLAYGKVHHESALTAAQRGQLKIMRRNVLDKGLPKADIIAALNFSYLIFRERKTLLRYFRQCRLALKRDGILVLDILGGTDCTTVNVERDRIEGRGLTYYWDQHSFDPITHHATFFIHFKRDGEPVRRRVFRYDWRLWSIPELRDILADAGFGCTRVLWEGSNSDGTGNGVFREAQRGEPCAGWVAYIVAER